MTRRRRHHLPHTALAAALALLALLLAPRPAVAQVDVDTHAVPLDATAVEELSGMTFPAPAAPPEPPLVPKARFVIDPVVDGTLVTMALGFAVFSELTISSGELSAQQPGDPDNLLAIDRWVVERPNAISENSALASDILIATLAVGAVADAIVAGYRYDLDEGLATGALYIEALLLNWTMVNIVKLGVRRPRPRAYVLAARNPDEPLDNDTNAALSFYSGHAALSAGMAASAVYMMFAREGVDSWLPWTVLGLGAAVSLAVAVERVEAGSHFPTDVIAGWLFGAGIGVLVPHFHRVDPSVWSLDFFGNVQDTGGLALTHRF